MKPKFQAQFPISLEEALLRLADGDPIECAMEFNGVTHPVMQPRSQILKILSEAAEKNCIDESGFMAQRSDLGIHVPASHPIYGLGVLFIATKPERRLTQEQLLAREAEGAEEISKELAEQWAEAKRIAPTKPTPKDYN